MFQTNEEESVLRNWTRPGRVGRVVEITALETCIPWLLYIRFLRLLIISIFNLYWNSVVLALLLSFEVDMLLTFFFLLLFYWPKLGRIICSSPPNLSSLYVYLFLDLFPSLLHPQKRQNDWMVFLFGLFVGKTPQEFRRAFNIDKPFTEEEENLILEELRWSRDL